MKYTLNTSSIDYFFKLCSIIGLTTPKNYNYTFFEKLYKSVFNFNEVNDINLLYYNTGLESKEIYLENYKNFDEILFMFGYPVDTWNFSEDEVDTFLYEYAPWLPTDISSESGQFYNKLEETNDYWWYLVLMIQRLGSILRDPLYIVVDKLTRYKEIRDKLKNHLKEISILAARLEMMHQYEFISKDNFLKADFSTVDTTNLKSIDIIEIPEYDVDEYIQIRGKFYKPLDVFLSITAASGMAQSLERQDLEGKMVNSSDYSKKINKIGVKL